MSDDNTAVAPAVTPKSLRMMSVRDAETWYNKFKEFSTSILRKDVDFGVITGVEKPSLLKPGAEKLRVAYSLTVLMDEVDKTIDFDRGYIDYTYKATVKTKEGQIIAQCEGSFNSWEPKTRYLWVKENEIPADTDKSTLKVRESSISEFDFAINKGETSGQYGKPAEYWQKFRDAIKNGSAKKISRKTKNGESPAWEISSKLYRIQNPDIFGLKNTIQKMAQKRAFVGAMLIATGASEFYTQDVEDMDQFNPEVANDTPKSPKPAEKREEVVDGEVVTDSPAEKAEDVDNFPDATAADEAFGEDIKRESSCTCGAAERGQQYHSRLCPMFQANQA